MPIHDVEEGKGETQRQEVESVRSVLHSDKYNELNIRMVYFNEVSCGWAKNGMLDICTGAKSSSARALRAHALPRV